MFIATSLNTRIVAPEERKGYGIRKIATCRTYGAGRVLQRPLTINIVSLRDYDLVKLDNIQIPMML